MIDPIKFSKLLYSFLLLPVYVYHKGALTAAFPDQPSCLHPPLHYLNQLCSMEGSISHIETQQNSYYGSVLTEDGEYRIIIGPVQPFRFENRSFLALKSEYAIPPEEEWQAHVFFTTLSPMPFSQFARLLIFIQYAWGRKDYTSSSLSLRHENSKQFLSSLQEEKTKFLQGLKEEALYDNYAIEQELLGIIERGDTKNLESFGLKAQKLSRFGVLAPDSLRQIKNTSLIAVTLVSRASVRGGLPAPLAYSLADIYIRRMETARTTSEALSLIQAMQWDFCSRVAENRHLQHTGDTITNVIGFIHKNTNRPLHTQDVADAFGLSRTYLSRKFKEELGFGLSDFIRRCKLEEGKSLLAYSNKTISEISFYLGFSSQSHFQTLFKKQFGITPLAYRQSDIADRYS